MCDNTIGQDRYKLNFLIDYLGDPISHKKINIIKEKNNIGEIKEIIKSDICKYKIINNIPSMIIPNTILFQNLNSKYYKAWKEVQLIGEKSYLEDGSKGNFSDINWEPALDVRRQINEICNNNNNNLILDIGCGLLTKPSYMMELPTSIKFIGMDPIIGYKEREFPFVQAYGDFIPFKYNTFDIILYISSIDHLIHPERSLIDCLKILKPGGILLIQETIRKLNYNYYKWLIKSYFKPSKFNKFHNYAFTEKSLKSIVKKVGFVNISIKKTCYANEIMIIAKKKKE